MLIENTDTSSDTGSFDTAVAAFEQILDREDAATTDQPKRKPERKEAEGDEPEALTADPEDETADDDDADAEEADSDDDEGAEEEADADAEDDDEGDEDPDRLVTVKIDGKTQKIKLSEAIAGYQRQADYSRKTEALASERKAIEAEVAAVRQERGQYAYLLENLAKQLDTAAAREPDWERSTPNSSVFKSRPRVRRSRRSNPPSKPSVPSCTRLFRRGRTKSGGRRIV
jgi:hypothetical protein